MMVRVEKARQPSITREEVIARIEDARGGEPEAFQLTLNELLSAPGLSDTLRAKVERELGLHFYYELEDPSQAVGHLCGARRLDPKQAAGDLDLLTALEGIYEDLGDAEGLLDIYRAKQASSTDPGMTAVYAVLMGELLWERLDQGDEARRVLRLVLEAQPDSDPVLELLARIAKESGDTETATELLRTMVARQAPGEYERQDGLRQLGRLLHERVEATTDASEAHELSLEAIEVYQDLLLEITGDSDAMAALKRLYESTGLHHENIALLGRELELLVAAESGSFPNGPQLEKLVEISYSDALAIPISLIFTDAGRAATRANNVSSGVSFFDGAVAVWSENADAIAEKLDLIRGAANAEELCQELAVALEEMANLFLDPSDRLSTLLEAAEVYSRKPEFEAKATALAKEIVEAASENSELADVAFSAHALLARLGHLEGPGLQRVETTQDVPAMRLDAALRSDVTDPTKLETREIPSSSMPGVDEDWTRDALEAAMPDLATSSHSGDPQVTREIASVDSQSTDPTKQLETRVVMPARKPTDGGEP